MSTRTFFSLLIEEDIDSEEQNDLGVTGLREASALFIGLLVYARAKSPASVFVSRQSNQNHIFVSSFSMSSFQNIDSLWTATKGHLISYHGYYSGTVPSRAAENPR